MNLLVSCDDNYAPHLGVLLASVFSHTKTSQILRVFIIDCDISQSNIEKISTLVRISNSEIYFLEPDYEAFKDLPSNRYGLAAYQRLLAAKLLPSEIDHCIYVDTDVIFNQDIERLWIKVASIDQPLAAIENFSQKPSQINNIERAQYFNSGVLGINLHYWRKNNVFNDIMLYLQNKPNSPFPDQDALNKVFENNWTRLDLKWNVQADVFGVIEKYYDKDCGYSIDELVDAAKNPGIVHFIGTQKPWFWNCYSPYKKLFLAAKANSAWRDVPPADDSFKARLKNKMALKKHLRRIKLEKWLANEEANSL